MSGRPTAVVAGKVAQKRRIGHGAQRGRRGVHHVAPKSINA
jgi:hypothetical protein